MGNIGLIKIKKTIINYIEANEERFVCEINKNKHKWNWKIQLFIQY